MDLHRYADRLGVHVAYAEICAWGRFDQLARRVTLRPDLGAVQERCTLAHELGHAYWEHTESGPRQEKQADEHAARLLIPPPAWAWATSQAGSLGEVAAELGVLPRLVEVAHTIYQDYTPCQAW